MADTKITIRDIAEMAGVSKTTVSFYLNGKTQKMSEETREKIRSIIEETGYQPNIAARSLSQKHSHLIGVIIGDITNSFSNKIVKGIEDSAREHGYQILIGNSNYTAKTESTYIRQMLTLSVDGFIIQPTTGFGAARELLNKMEKPYVFFDSKTYDEDTNWVKTDNYDATFRTVELLIEKGYQRFLVIHADPKLLSTRLERSQGFTEAVLLHKLELNSLIITEAALDVNKIANFIREHTRDGVPTLVYVPNCWALPTVYQALEACRTLMPDKIGLIGFDNTDWADFASPRVTTIVQPAYEEGQKATDILIDLIEDRHEENLHQVLPCSVHWSETTM